MPTLLNENNAINCTYFSACTDCRQQEQEISCFKKIAGVLSSEEVKKHGLILNAVENHFSPTVYDLSLGDFHYVYEIDAQGKSTRTQVCIGSANVMNKENKKPGEPFVRQHRNTNCTEFRIPALGAALIQLNEIVDTLTIANNENILVTGRFDLKLSLVNKGLVSQQGTQIEPCYRGRLYCFIHNFSSDDIILYRGQKIASVEFSYVSCFCNAEKRKSVREQMISDNSTRYKKDEYCDEGKGIINVRYFSSRPDIKLPEACGLLSAAVKAVKDSKEAVLQEGVINNIKDHVINEVYPDIKKERMKNRTSIIIALITAVLLFLGTCVTAWATTINPMIEANKEYKSKIETYQNEVKTYQDEMKRLEKDLNDMSNRIGNNNTLLNTTNGQSKP